MFKNNTLTDSSVKKATPILMNVEPTADEALMLAYKAGDNRAFEELIARHKKGIYNFLYRFLRQDQNVEEAFQEVFVRVIRASDSYTPTAKFTTWLYTIARNYCIDLSRQGRHRRMQVSLPDDRSGENESIKWEDRIPDYRPGPDSQVTAQDLATKLEEALQRINPDQKEVFLLREYAGLSFEDITHIVGDSVNTVKSRMRYALLALQDQFKKIGIQDPK